MGAFKKCAYNRAHIFKSEAPAEPKHLFKVVASHIEAALDQSEPLVMVDVGCGSGDFPAHLAERIANAKMTGVEFDPSLVEFSREKYPDLEVIQGDANDLKQVPSASQDVTTLIGVLGIFDEFEPALGECLRVTREGGMVIVVAPLNEHQLDVLIRWRKSGDKTSQFSRGWNLFSKASIDAMLKKEPRVRDWAYEKFVLPFDLAARAEDPIRTWTERDAAGNRILVNGLQMEANFQILSISMGQVR